MIINKQIRFFKPGFNLNVEFIKMQGFVAKNPLTIQKIECIMSTAIEINLQLGSKDCRDHRE